MDSHNAVYIYTARTDFIKQNCLYMYH